MRACRFRQEHVMDPNTAGLPSDAVRQDEADEHAPDPRQHYASPEQLADDPALGVAEREALLLEWKYELEQRLGATSEGMRAAEPADEADYARFAAELRRVSNALDRVSQGHSVT
jgi:hypothetical protein